MANKGGGNVGDFTPAQLLKIKTMIDEATKPLNESVTKLTAKIVLTDETKTKRKYNHASIKCCYLVEFQHEI